MNVKDFAFILYKLELMEAYDLQGWNVTRVPGGWIFRTNREASEVFVPFNNEFQEVASDVSKV